jgi:hypothetical protein
MAVAGLILAVSMGRAWAVEPAEELLGLVPPDAALVITVEGLREQARTWAGSRLASDIHRVPVVRSWLESDKFRMWKRSCSEIEALLGVSLPEVRDELLGDAVVLALRLDPDAPADSSRARGLLLLRARDFPLLERLIQAINTAQKESGELGQVSDRRRAGTTYHVREFPAGSGRLSEWYVTFPDGTFAFSNSEGLIQSVIDRKGRTPVQEGGSGARAVANPAGTAVAPIEPGLGELPKVRAVRRHLPARAVARLYVDSRPIGRLLAASAPPRRAAEARLFAMIERYLAAVEFAGAALVFSPDAIVVHSVETLDPARLDPWLRHWAGNARASDPALRRIPETALALATARIDAPSLRDAVFVVVAEEDQDWLRNIEALLTGLLLGQDLPTRILPCLGPGLVAYFDSPVESSELGDRPEAPATRSGLLPLVVAIGFSEETGATRPAGGAGAQSTQSSPAPVPVAAALENALRTLLALTALDENHGQGRSRITTRDVAGATVTMLDIPLTFAYAVDRVHARLVLGSSAAAVARYLESSSDPEAGRRFREFQAAAFPGFENFVCVDLDAWTRLADRYRDRLARNLAVRQKRPATDVETDLGHVLALARLFRAAFVASRIEPDVTAVHHTLGVVLRGPDSTQPRNP